MFGEDPSLDDFDYDEFVKDEFGSRVKPRGAVHFLVARRHRRDRGARCGLRTTGWLVNGIHAMLSHVPPYLGIGFLLSEMVLAFRRRASAKGSAVNHDAGSLQILWVVISASIFAGFSLAARGVGPRLPVGLPWPLIGVAVFAPGAALRWWSIWHLGRFFTVNVAVAADHRVVDTGPYRFVRHPSYTGLLLQLAGLGLSLHALPSLLVMLILPTLAILYRIRIEEAALRAHLVEAYAEYSLRTKKIVPLIF